GTKIRFRQTSLALVIPGQSRDDRDESSHDTAACRQNTRKRVGAGNEPTVSKTRHHYAQIYGRRLPDQSCRPDECAAKEHPTPARLFFALQEGEDTQRERKRGENLGVRGQRVTRPVGVDKHGISDATPCPCPFVSHTRANPSYDQRGGCDHEDREKMYSQEVIASRNSEDAGVNVIHPRRLRIHRGVVECPAVQGILRDYSVIALIAI